MPIPKTMIISGNSPASTLAVLAVRSTTMLSGIVIVFYIIYLLGSMRSVFL